MSAPRICFLAYLSRSGSTLLARLMSERLQVCVTPEGSLPAEFLGVNGFTPPVFGSAAEAEGYLRSVEKVSKLADWGLDYAQATAGMSWPADGPALFARLLECYRDRVSPGDPVVCYKGDPVMPWEVARALAASPGARAIHVVRDPRAVLNSQRSSRYAYEGGAFTYAPAHTAVEWRRLARAVAQAGERESWLRYEDLVSDPDAALARVSAFLEIGAREGGGASFLDRVAEAERHLHARVGEAPQAARIEGWRTELDAGAADLLQEMVRGEMQALGYRVEQGRRPGRAEVAASWLRWRTLAARANLRRRLDVLRRDPRYFARKVLARLGLAA